MTRTVLMSGHENAENGESDMNNTEDVPSPLIYGRKTTNPTNIKKPQKGIDLSWLNPWNLQRVIHLQIKRPQVK